MPKANYASGASGALSGAATGAVMGSVVPVIGTGLGAIGGGIIGGLTGLFGGSKAKKPKVKQASLQTKEQQELARLINQGLLEGKGPFADLFGKFNEAEFNKGVAAPQLRKFREETLPTLQEKYIANNQVLGTGMQRAKARAATDFQERLAGLQYQAQEKQNANRLAGISAQMGGGKVENIVQQGTPSSSDAFIKSTGENADKYLKILTDAYKESQKKPEVTPVETSAVAGGV